MPKFTEKIGSMELSYEGSTVEEVIQLKQAFNPAVVVQKKEFNQKEVDYLLKLIREPAECSIGGAKT